MINQSTTIEHKKRNRSRIVISILIITAIYFLCKLYLGYQLVQPEKYGVVFNSERQKLGIDKMPDTFILSKSPINNIFNYYNASGIYTADYSSISEIDSGLVKVKIDIDEKKIGIIREYRYYVSNNDTICKIYNYYDR